MAHTLEVFFNETLVFFSDGKWLHPIFELEDFLATSDHDPATLRARDKIIGKAAALLLIRLGIRDVYGGIMSELGQQALEKYDVLYEYGTLVDRIDCRTEEILLDEFDLEKAYAILKQRAKR